MVVEHAPSTKPRLHGSAPSFGTIVSSLLATTASLIFSAVVKNGLISYVWRFVFAISFMLIIFGLYARRRVTESTLLRSRCKSKSR